MSPVRRDAGFTLLEVAIALFIAAILISGLLAVAQPVTAARNSRSMDRALSDIRDALMGYAIVNGRLPCPDTTGDGIGDAGSCGLIGDLPWAELGTGYQDDWGNHFRYRVESAYTSSSTLSLDTPATIQVCKDTACPAASELTDGTIYAPELVPTNRAVAVVISFGSNGNSPMSPDEVTNQGAAAKFVYRPQKLSWDATHFDDYVIWIGRAQLMKQMVAAGKLP